MNFVKKYWKILKPDIVAAINDFGHTGQLSHGSNSAFITLIPKVSDPQLISEYRPISLVSIHYKILSKLQAARLKKVLPFVISDKQSTFVEGRQILDCILVANEIVSWAKRSHFKLMLLKIDFAKAFDCMNWSFLDSVMSQMGFLEKWRLWISRCVSLARISVLVNGSPTDEFSMQRGLRQCDPLSPLLFIIALEAVNVMMVEAIEKGVFNGFKVGNDRIEVSHLQFADDALFVGSWSARNARNLIHLLNCFTDPSGLHVNLNKSSLFGVGVCDAEVVRLASKCHCSAGSLPFFYLGLPVGLNTNLIHNWKPVKDKFLRRMNGWAAKTLSIDGRFTLIKFVLNSLPLYFFSLFKAPKKLLSDLEKLHTKFFWGESGTSRKIIWASSNKLTGEFDRGGLKVGSLARKNLALLAKWWWRFRTKKENLWAWLIYSIYGESGGLVEPSSRVLSGVWPNIIKAGSVIRAAGIDLERNFRRQVGNGNSTLFWLDIWTGESTFASRFRRLFALELNKGCMIKDKFLSSNNSQCFAWEWRHWPRGREESELEELLLILRGMNPLTNQEDSWTWLGSPNGTFQARDVANSLNATLSSNSGIPTVWCKFLLRKINLFFWHARRSFLPCLLELPVKGISVPSLNCPLSAEAPERIDHILFRCTHPNASGRLWHVGGVLAPFLFAIVMTCCLRRPPYWYLLQLAQSGLLFCRYRFGQFEKVGIILSRVMKRSTFLRLSRCFLIFGFQPEAITSRSDWFLNPLHASMTGLS